MRETRLLAMQTFKSKERFACVALTPKEGWMKGPPSLTQHTRSEMINRPHFNVTLVYLFFKVM